tara:strand:- start:215 stop:1072 length:858 start_codon:yes stop_codon:yes gene_type:complete
MKKLFEFKLDREIKEIVSESSKNDKGETVTTEKEVVKEIKQKVLLRKPTRSLFDDAELFYGVKLSEGIKAGLLTRALLAKRFSNDGGVLSEDDKDRYAELYLKLYEVQLDAERLSSTPEKKRSKSDQEKLDNLLEDSADLRRQLTDFEMAQSSLFEQTAENRARNKTILWWVLHLSHLEDDDGNITPVFEGKDFEGRLDSYDAVEASEDEFDEMLLQKLIYYVSFWYVGRVTSQEEFEKLLEDSGETLDKEPEKTPEEPAKEPAKEEVKEEVKEDKSKEKKEEAK